MRRMAFCGMLAIVVFCAAWQSEAAVRESPSKKQKTTVKKPTVPPKDNRLVMKVDADGISVFTAGYIYFAQPASITSCGYNLYFAAKDSTAGKEELFIKRFAKTDMLCDTPQRKLVRATCEIAAPNKPADPNYRLDLFLEARQGAPYLVMYSRFHYLGEEPHQCVINWGMSAASDSDRFKWYAIPEEGRTKAYPLSKDKNGTKIANGKGHANWIFANNGKGYGAGLICPASMIGQNNGDEIFVNSVPPQDSIQKGKTMNVFMAFFPVQKNFKLLDTFYKDIAKTKWQFD